MPASRYYAHSTTQPDCSDWETWLDHAEAVAELAGALAAKFGMAKAGRLAGQLHDLGKLCREFQDYIKQLRKAGPDHSTAGAQVVVTLATGPMDRLIASLLGFGIAGHHGGLPDASDLSARLKKADLPQLDPSWREMLPHDAADLMRRDFKPHSPQRAAFQLAFLGRMLFSCLVDADSLCTEAFYNRVDGRLADRTWPELPQNVDRLIAGFDAYMAAKLADMDAARRVAPLNLLRGDILVHVRAKAALPRGIYSLDVPTGGGKTLASLAFALEHAKRWDMQRIIYAIPFTSIIDQTAAIFRDVLGPEVVLEHHSNIETAKEDDEKAPISGSTVEARMRLAMENWQAPVVVTTNVQLFESLFAHRRSRCRKLHNLCNAVIILDEVQTIPLHVLRPCIAALDELARNYGCTIVLCTATQPALLAPAFKDGFENVVELAPEPAKLHQAFRRVTPRMCGVMTDAALVQELQSVRQGLLIVNSRGHARKLYLEARQAGIPGLIHLTTRQTAADRRVILANVRRLLAQDEPCVVIATSLIEAGVDVSFPRVWRAEAGLDQIIRGSVD